MNLRGLACLSFAATLAVPVLAHAQDFTPTGDRILSDPTYLPLQGQFYGQSGYGYEQTNGNLFDSTATQLTTTRNSLNTIRQSFAFGITDEFSINAGIAYGFDGRSSANGVTTASRSGFENPTLGATYRVFDQRNRPLSLDLFADYAPDAFQARNAPLGQDGTVAQGGSQADFGVAVGRETRFFTIRGMFADRYFGDSSVLNTSSGNSAVTSSYWVPTISVQTQTRFTDRLSANVGFSYNFQPRRNTITAQGVQIVDNVSNNQNVNVSLNYHFIPNRLVGSINYDHTFFGGLTENFPADPTDNTLVTRSGDSVGATLRYVFK